MPSSTSWTEYATSSARSMTCASRHCRPAAAAPSRSQSKTGRSSSYTPNFVVAGSRGQGYLRAGVERGPGQVEPDRAAVRVDGLGLEPGQQPQGLGVALEAAARLAQLGERPLAVVAERRVAEVVRQGGRLGDVGLAAERARQVAGDLGHLEAVGQPVADEVVGLRPDHLGLGRQPPERRGVDDPGPVALERGPLGGLDPLGRLGDEPLARVRVVEVLGVHRCHPRVARPGPGCGRRGEVGQPGMGVSSARGAAWSSVSSRVLSPSTRTRSLRRSTNIQ